MKDKAEAALERYKMLEGCEHVVIGVSGGADSMALLNFLCSVSEKYGIQLTACHVNHGIRGEEALRDQLFVEDACKKLGVECRIVVYDIPLLAKECGRSAEQCGREMRYEAFARIAREKNAKIATAHTLSDSLETILLNLARGTGLKGLCGIPAVRNNIIRPLIEATREEIEQYCEYNHIQYITDSSNLTHDYTRNKIRLDVIPVLKQINPSCESAVCRAIRSLNEDEAYLSTMAEQAVTGSQKDSGYDIKLLQKLPPALLNRAILIILKRYGIEPQSQFILTINEMILLGEGKITLTQNTYAEVIAGEILKIHTIKSLVHYNYYVPVKQSEIDLYSGVKATFTIISAEEYKNSKKIHPMLLKNALDYDNIIGTAVFRSKREGDMLTQKARGCTKTLKKLFNEAKISVNERNLVPVLTDDMGVAWVEGFGCDSRLEITDKTLRVGVIEIIRETDKNTV